MYPKQIFYLFKIYKIEEINNLYNGFQINNFMYCQKKKFDERFFQLLKKYINK